MNITRAFDGFEAALKSVRVAEIAALGARGPQASDAAQNLETCLGLLRDASVRLWALPVRGPTDLVLKARALRWHFPEGVDAGGSERLGAQQPPTPDAPLGAIALHYIMRDLFALSA